MMLLRITYVPKNRTVTDKIVVVCFLLGDSPASELYRVSQEECARLRESVPYVKLYRYNPKHLYPKLNGYGDNGLRKVWTSCISAYCTSTDVVHWPWHCNKSSHLCDCTRPAQRDKTVLHYCQIFMRNVQCLVTLRTTMTWVRVFL